MVHFSNGNNANNYVTLNTSAAENDIIKEAKKESTYERIVKKTQCKGDVMVVKIITTILVFAMMSLSYMSYVQNNEIKSMRVQVTTEYQTPNERASNDKVVCNFSIGYAAGSSRIKIGYQAENACINACLNRKKIDVTINGVTLHTAKRGCWCEQNMTSIIGRYKSCFFKSNDTQIRTDLNVTSTCKFIPGNGYGGSSVYLGRQNISACINACMHLKKVNADINGVSVHSRTVYDGGCWCERRMKSITPSIIFKTCFLESNNPYQHIGLDGSSICNFSIGDGAGGPELKIGYQRGYACINACFRMKKIDATINGVTVYTDDNRGGCWCEQNMTSISATYKTCFLKSVNSSLNDTSSCTFSLSDGGGSKFKIGNQKGNACIDACLHMKRIDAAINGVTVYSKADKEGCWCHHNMTRITGTYKTCFLKSNDIQVPTGLNGTSTCELVSGDGSGGSEFKIGNQKGGACINACFHMKTIDATINGVTLYANHSRGGCWCERHMTSTTPNKKYKTCFLTFNNPQNHTGLESTCKLSIGYGVAGFSIKIGHLKRSTCIDTCLHMKNIDATINGVTSYSSPHSVSCWCKRNMTRIRGTYKTCFLKLGQ